MQKYQKLGDFGDDGRSYGLATDTASQWFKELDGGVIAEAGYTVRAACEDYVQAKRDDGADSKADEIEARFKRYVYPEPIAKVALSKLRATHVAAWLRDRLQTALDQIKSDDERVLRAKRSTVDRDVTPLRAALNRAHDRGLIASDIAWRNELKALKSAGNKRDVYLTKADRKRLVAKAEPVVRSFLEALRLLPLRPGAVAQLKVRDFDARRSTLNIGKDKGHTRRITLPAKIAAFLAKCAKGKGADDPLIDYRGAVWNKDAWKKPVKQAVNAAKLPENVTAYALRHSLISDLVTAGTPLLSIAQLSGTSVAMIEAHYGHLHPQSGADALAGLV